MADTLLVTGANGFVALHVIKDAITQGYKVVGTVRSIAAAEKIMKVFPHSSSQLQIIEVHDITKANNFEMAFRKFKIGAPKDVKTDVLDPAIKSGVAVLEASAKYAGPRLRRVIHVGSFVPTLDLDWNQLTYEESANENTPAFDMVSVDPAPIFGPHVGPVDLNHLNISTQMMWELVIPSPNPPPYNSGHLGVWVDVRDAGGERFLAAQRCHWQLVKDEARRVLPELQNRIDAGKPGSWIAAQGATYDVDGSKVERILGVQYRSLGECLKDSYKQLLEAEKRETLTY
ncbi:NAD(P)-binding protein [Trichoderma asperelloides]|nr:NAD(P)-binding protein [Trichoderma asperelloides]